jgi:hypothetical protein
MAVNPIVTQQFFTNPHIFHMAYHLTPLFESPRYIDTPQASEVRLIQQQHQLICIRHKGTDRFQGLGLQQQVLLVDADPIQPEGAIGEESATQICQPWMVQKSWILAILKEKKARKPWVYP